MSRRRIGAGVSTSSASPWTRFASRQRSRAPEQASGCPSASRGGSFHTDQLLKITGLEVGEGQATILMNDLRSHIGEVVDQLQQTLPSSSLAERLKSRRRI